MHPILIEIGIIKIYSYGFMLALSFFTGILVASARARKRGVEPSLIYDLSIVLIIGAIVGSRGLYIITHRDSYHGIVDMIALWQGGAVYYGGMLLAVAGAIIFLRIKNTSFLKVADILSPSVGVGIFFTRIGCFLSGCCFGHPTNICTGVVFPHNSPAGFQYPDIHIHPTQLYSSAYGLIIFILLILVEKIRFAEGSTFGFMFIFYGIARFIVDYFRYYEESAMIGAFTFNQLISMGLIVGGAIFVLVVNLNNRKVKKFE
jgi:phosphatidylglycerol:prolipoprotein diacylglycerol transferase